MHVFSSLRFLDFLRVIPAVSSFRFRNPPEYFLNFLVLRVPFLYFHFAATGAPASILLQFSSVVSLPLRLCVHFDFHVDAFFPRIATLFVFCEFLFLVSVFLRYHFPLRG